MTNYLNIKDPNLLHAAVDRRVHEDPFAFMVADATVDASSAATNYAPDNRRLLADEWVRRSVEAVAHDDDSPHGLPDADQAVIVRSQSMSTTEFAGDEWHRSVHPLREDGGPISSGRGACDRCDLNMFLRDLVGGDLVVQKPLTIFHIARGRFVVEFQVCDECYIEILLDCGPIIQVVRRGTV